MYSPKVNALVSLISKMNPQLDTNQIYNWTFHFDKVLNLDFISLERAAIEKIVNSYSQTMFDEGTQPHELVLGIYEAKTMGVLDSSGIIIEIKQGDRGIWLKLNILVIDSLHAIIVR